ncbi:hypothetical protein V1525DRAFT_405278 [Lipomyces kononenkoae]|uniref:Uncharacterized protein n=1 Tax=Lipomyces kononenkoae TaxID=34357 RepID=A0ACC3SZX7_LIPKO
MDIVLETADAFFFDHVYAKLFPVPQAVTSLLQATEPSNELLFSLSKNLSLPYIPSARYEYTFVSAPTAAYLSTIPRTDIVRQFISLFLITWTFGLVIYFVFASLSYVLIYDKRNMDHPKFLKNQMRMEIHQALTSMPIMSLLTVPWFVAEIRGHSLLYWDVNDHGLAYLFLQFPLFVLFTDFSIYLIHRGLHHPILYKRLHKPHHKWIVPTPYASLAFHPIDGYLQSLPYHMFPFVFPLQKISYLLLFVNINLWTILIHDGEYMTNNPLINGAACHTLHHLYFNYNYGQFTTLWDRIGRSYRTPEKSLFDQKAKMSAATWKQQATEMEKIVKDVEQDDDRQYLNSGAAETEQDGDRQYLNSGATETKKDK